MSFLTRLPFYPTEKYFCALLRRKLTDIKIKEAPYYLFSFNSILSGLNFKTLKYSLELFIYKKKLLNDIILKL